MSFTGPSLRDRLRTGTRLSQEALERVQRRFDLTTDDGLRAFLCAQQAVLATLRKQAPDLAGALDAALARLAADLADLGQTAAAKPMPAPRADAATGRAYVWHSQQLGLRMLARRMPDPPPAATRFLTAPRDVAAWRALCDELEATPGYGGDADAVLAAANDWLAVFEAAALAQARTGD